MHGNEEGHEGFTREEITIINSIIDIRNVSVKKIMITMEKTFKLLESDVISDSLIKKIQEKSYSKIPIIKTNGHCKGFLKSK